MATLHFFCGKVGAGKSRLARSLDGFVVSEDEWLATLGFEIATLADYVAASNKCRALMAVVVPDLLRRGVDVVLDFAANTPARRTWVRTLYEPAGADHVLHWLDTPDDVCLANLHARNAARPAGSYFGDVSDDLFHATAAHFAAPSPDEGFVVDRRA